MVVGGLLASSSAPAVGQTLATQPFSGYGSGDVIAVNALNLPPTNIAGLRAAASGGNVNSAATGLTAQLNEFGQNVGPARGDKNAYGRGAAVEAGLLTGSTQPVDINQIIVSGLAEAFAPPPTPLVRAAIDPVTDADDLARRRAAVAPQALPEECPLFPAPRTLV